MSGTRSEHPIEETHLLDLELKAMCRISLSLEPLDIEARNRVLNWAKARFCNAPTREILQNGSKLRRDG